MYNKNLFDIITINLIEEDSCGAHNNSHAQYLWKVFGKLTNLQKEYENNA